MVLSIAAIRGPLRATKNLRDSSCYTMQFSSNLSRNGIARQVAEKIAQCNRVFTPPRSFYLVHSMSIWHNPFTRSYYDSREAHGQNSRLFFGVVFGSARPQYCTMVSSILAQRNQERPSSLGRSEHLARNVFTKEQRPVPQKLDD